VVPGLSALILRGIELVQGRGPAFAARVGILLPPRGAAFAELRRRAAGVTWRGIMVVMEEQANGRPADDGANAVPVTGTAPVNDHRVGTATAGRVRQTTQKLINVLAGAVRLVAAAFAVILLLRIGLAFVAVNPQNVIAEWIVRTADVLVWGFRDLFVPADPRIGLLANYGLAAVFWMVVGFVVAAVLSGLGQLVAGRGGS